MEWPLPHSHSSNNFSESACDRERLDRADREITRVGLASRCVESLATFEPQQIESAYGREGLSREVLEDVLQESAKRFLRRELSRRGADFDEICRLLVYFGGFMFGSCPMAALLGQDWFHDVDVVLPSPVSNQTVRWFARKIFRDVPTEEGYWPRTVCEHAAKSNGDPEVFRYIRQHQTPTMSMDVAETSDLRAFFSCAILDVDLLIFDGLRFRFLDSSRTILEFAFDARCKIERTGSGLAFEAIYDPWCTECMFANQGIPRNPSFQTDCAHLGIDYVERFDWSGKEFAPDKKVGLEKLHESVLVALELGKLSADLLPIWISKSDLEDLSKLRDAVVPRFSESKNHLGEPLTEYLVLKLFLRLLKLSVRGIPCANLGSCFSRFPRSFPPKRIPLELHRYPKLPPPSKRRLI